MRCTRALLLLAAAVALASAQPDALPAALDTAPPAIDLHAAAAAAAAAEAQQDQQLAAVAAAVDLQSAAAVAEQTAPAGLVQPATLVVCTGTPSVANGTLNGCLYNFLGFSCFGKCNTGYVSSVAGSTTWTGINFLSATCAYSFNTFTFGWQYLGAPCRKVCSGLPRTVTGINWSGCQGAAGDVCTRTCSNGRVITSTCFANGTWAAPSRTSCTGTAAVRRARRAGLPVDSLDPAGAAAAPARGDVTAQTLGYTCAGRATVANATFSTCPANANLGTVCFGACNPGYVNVYGVLNIVTAACTFSGWSYLFSPCQRVCSTFPPVTVSGAGVWLCNGRVQGSTCTALCTLTGKRVTAACQSNGLWAVSGTCAAAGIRSAADVTIEAAPKGPEAAAAAAAPADPAAAGVPAVPAAAP